MFRLSLFVLAICACIVTSCGSNNATQLDVPTREVSSVNATNAWNSVCFQYNFIPKPNDTIRTFAMGYYGSNFTTDFAAIKTRVNQILSIPMDPTPGEDVMGGPMDPTPGNDVMKIKIENWDY